MPVATNHDTVTVLLVTPDMSSEKKVVIDREVPHATSVALKPLLGGHADAAEMADPVRGGVEMWSHMDDYEVAPLNNAASRLVTSFLASDEHGAAIRVYGTVVVAHRDTNGQCQSLSQGERIDVMTRLIGATHVRWQFECCDTEQRLPYCCSGGWYLQPCTADDDRSIAVEDAYSGQAQ